MLILLASSLVVLLFFLVIFSLVGKKKGKISNGGKFLTVLFSIFFFACSVITPLVHYNYIDINLRYGYFANVETNNGDKIKISRDSISYYNAGSHSHSKSGTYTLKNDVLVIMFGNNSQETYEVKGFGTDLYQNGVKVYSYLSNQGGMD